MSWKGVTVMDQRVCFIAEYVKEYYPSLRCGYYIINDLELELLQVEHF